MTLVDATTSSLADRFNQSVRRGLHCDGKPKPKQRHKLLPLVLWCRRESKNDTIGVSPYMMVMGRDEELRLYLLQTHEVRSNLDQG